jgi:hypothetical protein
VLAHTASVLSRDDPPEPTADPRRTLAAFLQGLDPFVRRVILGRRPTDADAARWRGLTPDPRADTDITTATATYWRLVATVPEQLARELRRRRAFTELALLQYAGVSVVQRRRGAPRKRREQMRVASLVQDIEATAQRLAPAFERLPPARGVGAQGWLIERGYASHEISAVIRSRTPQAAAVRIFAEQQGLTYGSLQTALSRWRARADEQTPPSFNNNSQPHFLSGHAPVLLRE